MNTHVITKQHEKQTTKVKYLTLTGLIAAMITIMTAYIGHIPFGANGGYIHFGDSLVYLAGVLLPTPYALAAAAIGGGLADLMTSPMWAPATIIIKMLMTLPFSCKSSKIITPRNVFCATLIGYFINHTGYFFAEYILFGSFSTAFFGSIGGVIQSGGSAIFFVIFGLALDKIHMKAKLFNQLTA